MKRVLGSFVLLLTVTAPPATAQESAVPRADVQGTVDWQNLKGGPSESSNDWINGIAAADAAFGWYWTDHLRSQVDVSAGTTGSQYRVEGLNNSFERFTSVERLVRPSSVGISQQYQFFRNAY